MKALTITAPLEAELREIPDPEPADGEVLLRVRRVGFCGSDLKTYRGENPLAAPPRIPGHEVAATIEALGPGFPGDWTVGQNVTLSPYTSCGRCAACRRGRPNACEQNQTLGVQRDGALCERIIAPAEKLFRSETLSLDELALVEPLTVGFHAVDRGEAAEGETVMVLGCGMIGLGAIAASARRGARVIAVDIDDDKLETARQAGADETVNSADESLAEAADRLTDGGPDVVIEAIGLPATFVAAVEVVAFTGRVVYIGYARQPVEYQTKLFVQKELDIRGSRNALGDFAEVIAMLEAGGFPIEAVITQRAPLAEAGDALAAWHENPAATTKILIDLD